MSDKNKFKRFATGSATTDSIAASLKPAEGDDSGYESIPLIRIHPDPENPRHLDLDAANPRQVAEDDPRREEKLAEIEDLENLALSIASQGVLTPIRVYRVGRDFRIAHGERRYLASVMAGCGSILSIVLKERPDNLRLQQLIENFQRKGLSLFRRCENIRSVVKESEQLGNGHVDVDKLRELTGIGRTQAFQYMAILAAPKDVWDAMIKEGRVVSLSEVAKSGASKPKPAMGRPAVVKLGTTPRTDVARRIIEAVGGVGRYDIDWTDPGEVTKIFKQLIKDIEEDKL